MAQAPPMDGARFTRIYEAHAQRVLRYCLFRLGTRTDAEDAFFVHFADAIVTVEADQPPDDALVERSVERLRRAN